MKRIVRTMVFCGLLIIWTVSCDAVTPGPNTMPNWWTSWLAQPVCKPPCWQDITPGQTTRDEAAAILENTPGIVITYNKKDGLSWNFGTKAEGGSIILSEDGNVSGIWIGSVSANVLLLKTIIASYNEPVYVKPIDCREGKCVIALAYPDLGMFLTVFVENERMTNNPPRFEILPDTIVDRIYFIEPGIEKFQEISFIPDYGLLISWKGYGTYP